MDHPFDTYYRKHAHGPRIRIDSGVQRLTVEFSRGYVRIATSSPFSGEVYVTRSAFLALLQRVVPIARLWAKHPAPDHDVPAAVHQWYLDEQALDRDLREAKKTRRLTLDDTQRADRQRRRWLAAKARSERAATR